MKTVYIDQVNLLRAITRISKAGGIIDVVEQNEYINTCEVDDKGLEALEEAQVPFVGGKVETKKTPKKAEKATSLDTKKKLTSSAK